MEKKKSYKPWPMVVWSCGRCDSTLDLKKDKCEFCGIIIDKSKIK
jgi:hypothetical protein